MIKRVTATWFLLAVFTPLPTGAQTPVSDQQASIVGVSEAAPAQAGPFDDLTGRPYDEARRVLISRGISPVRMNHRVASPVCAEDFCRTYPEAFDCSEDAVRACAFVFWSGREDKFLMVVTVAYGEREPVVKGVVPPSASDERRILGGQ